MFTTTDTSSPVYERQRGFCGTEKNIGKKKKNRISPYCNFVSPYQFPELKAASFSVQMKGKNAGGCFPLRTGD